MSDDQTRPIEPEAPAPPPAPEQAAVQGQGPYPGQQPAYAMPLPAGYPAYAAAMAPMTQPRPRFADQVLGMRAVVATAIACLIVGGLGGFALGRATGDDGGGRFGPGPGVFQRGTFPRGFPQGQNGQPNQQFGPSQSPSQNGR